MKVDPKLEREVVALLDEFVENVNEGQVDPLDIGLSFIQVVAHSLVQYDDPREDFGDEVAGILTHVQMMRHHLDLMKDRNTRHGWPTT